MLNVLSKTKIEKGRGFVAPITLNLEERDAIDILILASCFLRRIDKSINELKTC